MLFYLRRGKKKNEEEEEEESDKEMRLWEKMKKKVWYYQ